MGRFLTHGRRDRALVVPTKPQTDIIAVSCLKKETFKGLRCNERADKGMKLQREQINWYPVPEGSMPCLCWSGLCLFRRTQFKRIFYNLLVCVVREKHRHIAHVTVRWLALSIHRVGLGGWVWIFRHDGVFTNRAISRVQTHLSLVPLSMLAYMVQITLYPTIASIFFGALSCSAFVFKVSILLFHPINCPRHYSSFSQCYF